MVSRNALTNVAIVVIIIGFAISIVTNIPSSNVKIYMFPGVIGDAVLRNNETGEQIIKNMTSYDDFHGNVVQGFKATYSGENGTVVIFVAQMSDNVSADRSFKDMIIRNGYNYSIRSNESIFGNITVIKLPVINPEIFAIQKNKNDTFHYTFTKLDKVYWIGFSKWDMEYQTNMDYQASMLMEIYINVDKKSIFGE